MKAVLSTCLFWAMLSPVVPLKCISAVNTTELSDENVSECKPGQNLCVAGVLNTKSVANREEVFYGCAASKVCHSGHYSFTSTQGKFLDMTIHCCSSDLCNNETLTIPDHNALTPNGMQCPACFAAKFQNCTSDKTVNCLGNENQCVHFEGALMEGFHKGDRFFFHGCATKDFCAIKEKQKNGFGHIVRIGNTIITARKENCYNAS
ncbi:phospholipase A2 inhibitor and Ly6/PLAUR domain-containing protein-like [Podarcis raffonei]|uniref:phospholipase A2 inhibitor and Ly6/PLAUR domain-containing protein-like n=1 Tax=Podarcis raffonei TaxID=65483 RepID=UPI0023299D94|nr:phospholipase A2 inhibitor and Ly6/PLAUR domain-containing protein-like [Podarcis raffonei]